MAFFNQVKITGANGATLDGTAGSPSTGVVTVQGVASGTAVKVDGSAVTQPVSGTVSINAIPAGSNVIGGVELVDSAGTNKASISAGGAVKVDGSAVAQPVKVQDGSGNAITSTGGKLDVNATFSGSISGNSAASATGSAVPAAADYVGAKDGSGNLVGLHAESVTNPNLRVAIYNGANEASVSAGGAVTVDGSAVTQPVSAASLPLPTGASTSAKQPALGTAGTASADVITVQGIASMTALKVDGSAVTQPVSGTVTTTPPSHASTNVDQLAGTTVDTNSGTKSAGTLRVVLATDQPALTNALKVDGSAVTQPVSGTVSINAIPAGSNLIGGVELVDSGGTNKASISAGGAVKMDGSGVTQPVSFAGSVTVTQSTPSSLTTLPYGTFRSPYQTSSLISISGNNTPVQADSMGRQEVTLAGSLGPFVLQKANATSTGSVTSLNASFGANNTPGNTIVVVAAAGSNAAMSVSDTLGNTYTQAANLAGSSTLQVAIFYSTNCLGGNNTNVTLACGSSSAALEIYEVHGLLTLPNQQGQAISSESQTATNNATSASATVASITPVLPNELAFTALGVGTANVTFSAFSPYTKDFSGNTGATQSGLFSFASFSQPLSGMAATSFAATLSGGEPWAACTVLFKPVAVPVEGTVTANSVQSGTWTTRVVGNSGSTLDAGLGVSTAPSNGLAVLGQYNTTIPTPITTQTVAIQIDSTGSQYVNTEGRKATYSAFASFTAAAGDIAVMPGAASKTVRVTRIEVSLSTSGTAAVEAVQLVKRSAADTSGTSASMTAVPHDSTSSAASAAPLNYTVAPTPGAAVGTIRGIQFNDQSANLPGSATWLWEFGTRPGASAIILRGTAQQLCVNLGAAVSTQTATVSFEWTEE